MKGHTVDRVIRIWDDTEGESITVGPDGDALGLVELRALNRDGKVIREITFSREEGLLVIQALAEYCGDDRNFPHDSSQSEAEPVTVVRQY